MFHSERTDENNNGFREKQLKHAKDDLNKKPNATQKE